VPEQAIEYRSPVEGHCAGPSAEFQVLPPGGGHVKHYPVNSRGQTADVSGLDDDRGIADRLAGATRHGGDNRSTSGQHLLGQGDAERLDEVGLGLRGQDETRAPAHEQRFLVVVDIGEENHSVVLLGHRLHVVSALT
jgi:hypothetical protein